MIVKQNTNILKKPIFFLFFFIFVISFSLQAQSERDSAELVLELKVLPNFPIGFGTCYKGYVTEVIKGNLKDKNITITILAADTTYEHLFNKDPERNIIEIGFKKYRTNEEYSVAVINGFVDKTRTSWKIIYIKLNELEKFF